MNRKKFMNCQICLKDVEPYKDERLLGGIIILSKLIPKACPNCFSPSDLTSKQDKRAIVDPVKYTEKFIKVNNEKTLKLHKVTIDLLVGKRKTMEILGIQDKHSIQFRVRMGIITPIKLWINETTYENYYLRTDLEKCKKIFDEGRFIVRAEKRVKKFSPNPLPSYIYKDTRGKQFIYQKFNDLKICCCCLKEKEKSEFGNQSGGLANDCTECVNASGKMRYKNMTPEEKKIYLNNIKQWVKDNKEKVKAYEKTPRARIIRSFRRRIKEVLKNALTNPNPELWRKSKEHLGCSEDELLKHLESLFKPGMTWDNYGEWHLDHVYPISSFDLTNEEEVKKINHYTNLQPLWAKDNEIKGGSTTKICKTCQKEQHYDEYYRNSHFWDGFHNECKSCQSEKNSLKYQFKKYIGEGFEVILEAAKETSKEQLEAYKKISLNQIDEKQPKLLNQLKELSKTFMTPEQIHALSLIEEEIKPILLKHCRKCDENKPYEQFSRKSDSKDGFKNFCKLCDIKVSKENYDKRKLNKP